MRRIFIAIIGLISYSVAQAQTAYSLKQLADSLIENSFQLRINRLQEEEARLQTGMAAAGAYPTVSLQAGNSQAFNNTRQEFFNGDIREASLAANQAWNAAVRADWTFFNGFRVWAQSAINETRHQLSSLITRARMEEELFQLASLYAELQAREQMLQNLKSTLSVSNENYRLAESRQRIGKANKQDVLQSLTNLNSDSSNYIKEENRILYLKLELKKLCGLKSGGMIQVGDTTNETAVPALDKLIENALAQNTDIRQQKAQVLISLKNEKLQKADRYPQLGLFAEYNFVQSANQVGILKSNTSLGPAFGLSFRYTLFDGFRVSRNISLAALQTKQSRLNEEQTSFELRISMAQAYDTYLLNRRLSELERQNSLLAEENLSLAQARLNNGVISAFDFRQVQESTLAAESRAIEANYELRRSALQLMLWSGDLLKAIYPAP
ncbi:MAG: TolC family protein [Bacteroidetes bacterium]|nr:MAG: TolC family protein [Bacteroidota bacterium]